MIRSLVILCAALSMSGCAGLFIAGAATTANIVTDTRTTKEIWQDNNIEFEVAAIGNKAPFKGKARVVASSYNGTVVLMGQAPTQDLINEFENKAREVKGVKNIHNQIKQKEPLSVTQISNDSWITTKVKSALLTDSELNGVKVKVITEDSDVFLFGYVTPAQSERATEIARNISGVKQVVKGFQYGDEKPLEVEEPEAANSETAVTEEVTVKEVDGQAN
ncbi:BON domain-containing protein [Vibrio campbellii]|jgi:osmotically-inducible protein OsmY|uniref:BON domain-containing protein n=2 Tax=Vibrio campbellii TaxID=680 RepID=A0AAE9SK68_9VIBR|nr:BON domain-containing protein [Vibrio campbellii]UTZ20748.1 BON domain-containing protein [Vibrio campbellii]UTZ26271.1 BON domain-containing protein [Vibrio campbellii]UTZ31911.1 BON domain-containing protein [Vibrio campbellii]UTZ40291.1 BON domain-containing protein [Vibrio campbellii]HDM8238852.1 BON domain-containing protein [Vibrio campbellii]